MARPKGTTNKAETKEQMKQRLETEVSQLQQRLLEQLEVTQTKCRQLEQAREQAEVEGKERVRELEQENEELRKLVASQEVEVTKYRNWKKNLEKGGKKQKFTSEEKYTIRMYNLQGKSIRTIAKELDCSVGLIHKILHEADGEWGSKIE